MVTIVTFKFVDWHISNITGVFYNTIIAPVYFFKKMSIVR